MVSSRQRHCHKFGERLGTLTPNFPHSGVSARSSDEDGLIVAIKAADVCALDYHGNGVQQAENTDALGQRRNVVSTAEQKGATVAA